MQRTTALLLLLLASAPAGAEVTISGDNGGDLRAYASRVGAARISGERVRIDGPCNSACTLYLTLPREQVCATPRASFIFHAAIDDKLRLPMPRETYELWRTYPPAVQIWIGQNGGLSHVPVRAAGAAVTRFVNRCR